MNVCLGMAYDGTMYSGFQKQPQSHVQTIQSVLEGVLQNLYQQPIRVVPSGRTDKGVHAEGQVVGFSSPNHLPIPVEKLQQILNNKLPGDIRILFSRKAPTNFHPRYAAQKRWYRYRFSKRTASDMFSLEALRFAYAPPHNLEARMLRPYLEPLVGVHDFSSFCSTHDSSASKVRHMYDITVEENALFVEVHFFANAFLQHMVRAMVGMVLDCCRRQSPVGRIAEALRRCDPSVVKQRAPAKGLCLKRVFYPNNLWAA